MDLNSSYYSLTSREQKLLHQSWAVGFYQNVFSHIDEERFSVLYSTNAASRPNTPVNVMLGLLILKEMTGMSDEGAFESLLFDARYQYALNTDSFQEQPLSKNSLSNFRCLVYSYYEQTGVDLIQEEVTSLAGRHAFEMETSGSLARMDSLMIASSSRNLSRMELIFQCISRMVKAMNSFSPETLTQRTLKYLHDGYRNELIYRDSGQSTQDKMDVLLQDALEPKRILNHYKEMEELKVLCIMVALLLCSVGWGEAITPQVIAQSSSGEIEGLYLFDDSYNIPLEEIVDENHALPISDIPEEMDTQVVQYLLDTRSTLQAHLQ